MYKIIPVFLCSILISGASFASVVRAAVDIGSGATELRVVEIDPATQKIIKVLESKSFAIPYQEDLSKSPEGNFSSEIRNRGLEALKQASEIAHKYPVEKVIGVATAAFRKANNSQEYIDDIKNKTGITIYVIDQHLEGELAFQAVRSQFGYRPEQLVVWDIGGGSLQLTTVNNYGHYEIYRSLDASIPFKMHVVEKIKKQDPTEVHSPNPITTEDLLKAQFHGLQLAQKVDRVFKEKILNQNVQIVGVGKIFGYQIPSMVGGKELTRDQMIHAVANLTDKSDEDVGGGDFANVHITNAILILGFMEGLQINKMQVADINPADGAFFYSPFWKGTDMRAYAQRPEPCGCYY